eukprot:gnl/MRDRNA2_/MRDRNA2_98596_c0_seq1.p1 gnl/MRDRNA2_/MRDRNA2_98596_c0~~gnl/MRDRNA2_/MRDRNA2_98596_c0_seq1.p1  ORF type:complete len:308 (+),score=66.03 gnl/MRDRNA2_/MRDRNA2_98596_c0_seq1:114-926(+)
MEAEMQTPRSKWGRYPGDSPFAPSVCESWSFMISDEEQVAEPFAMKRSVTEGESQSSSAVRKDLRFVVPGPQKSLSSSAVPYHFVTNCPAGSLWLPISSLERNGVKANYDRQSPTTSDGGMAWQHEVQKRRVEFKVPNNELHSTNKNAVSPLLELPWDPSVKLKMILSPPVCSETKGGASFRKCKGKDLKLEMKCEQGREAAGMLKFNFYIGVVHGGSENPETEQQRGPLAHDFSYNSVTGLPKEVPGWSFDLKSLAKDDHLVCGVEFLL